MGQRAWAGLMGCCVLGEDLDYTLRDGLDQVDEDVQAVYDLGYRMNFEQQGPLFLGTLYAHTDWDDADTDSIIQDDLSTIDIPTDRTKLLEKVEEALRHHHSQDGWIYLQRVYVWVRDTNTWALRLVPRWG